MYIPLQGNYTVGRSEIQQPSHDNPACGPQSSNPTFDCITHSGSGTTASFESVDVDLVGWANRTSAKTGDLLKYDIAPASDVGGFSVATDEIEWQWTPADPADGLPSDPGCRGLRHCEKYAVYSGKMEARAYTNGRMKYVTVANITILDKVWLEPVPASGRKGFRSVVTAKVLDNSGLQRIYWWRFYPDSNPSTYSSVCGEVNPCALNVNATGTLVMQFLQGNQVKYARTRLTVVPPSLTLTASKTTVGEGDSVTFTGTVLPDSTPYQVVGWSWASDAGVLASRAPIQRSSNSGLSTDRSRLQPLAPAAPPSRSDAPDGTMIADTVNAESDALGWTDNRPEPAACNNTTLSCTIAVTKPGTMTLSVRAGDSLLTQSVHVSLQYDCPDYFPSPLVIDVGELTVSARTKHVEVRWMAGLPVSTTTQLGVQTINISGPWTKVQDFGFVGPVGLPVARYRPTYASIPALNRSDFNPNTSWVEFRCRTRIYDVDNAGQLVYKGIMLFNNRVNIDWIRYTF